MPRVDILRSSPVTRSARVLQLEGLFEMPPSEQTGIAFTADLPIEQRAWNIGLIVGPSGSGKSSIARDVFGAHLVERFRWPAGSIVDAFPNGMSIKEIVALLSSVGFSSPPNWLRPFTALSNGEQFRAMVARALAERDVIALDEFTSVIDRTVAQVGSAAIAKTVRARGKKFVGVSCHYDIIGWLQPDWVYDTATHSFAWRQVQRRPDIRLTIRPVDRTAWHLFKHHHYLDTTLENAARCFLGTIGERPAAFASVLSFPHAQRPGWREHRTVCLPDFQGVGIGNALSDFVASLYMATGKPYRSVTSNPAMIYARARSRNWIMTRSPSLLTATGKTSKSKTGNFGNLVKSTNRLTAGFEYVGIARPDEARAFGVLRDSA